MQRVSRASEPIASSAAYLPVEEIARGGMGSVLLVLRQEASFRRLYAMKRLRPGLGDDAAFRRMFLDEARVAGLLRHPHVVSVLDVGEDAQGPFLVMDFIDGLPLSQIQHDFRSCGEMLPVQVCLRIAQHVAEGLHAAHELRGHDGEPLHLVHRDVSPQNVLIGFDGVARLTDFGVAKALGRQSSTTVDVLKGKVAYMSPEQLRFEEIDRRSDLFSLGVILYELLANDRLYFERDVSAAARRVLNDPPPDVGQARGDVPDEVVQLLFDLLCKDREHRPSTAREVATRIEEILLELVQHEEPLALAAYMDERYAASRETERARRAEAVAQAEREAARARSRRRMRRAISVGAAAAVALGAGAAAAWILAASPSDDPPSATVIIGEPSSHVPAPAAEPEASVPDQVADSDDREALAAGDEGGAVPVPVEDGSADAAAEAEESVAEPRRDRRRRWRRPRRPRPTEEQASPRADERLWGWE